eukprot:5255443-Amphidinium_carterae.3
MQPMLQQLQGTIVLACELLLGSTLPDQLLQLSQLPTAMGGIGMPNLPQLGILARTTAPRTIERLPHADVHLRQACHVEQPFLLDHLDKWVSIPPQGLIGDLERDSPGVSVHLLQKQLRRS